MAIKRNQIIWASAAAFLFYSMSRKQSGQSPVIVDIVDDLEKHPTKTFNTRSLADINKIIVHHYAGNGTPQAVAHYHVKPKIWVNKTPLEWDSSTGDYKKKNIGGRNWPGIAYHFTISKDGTIHKVNNFNTISYHVAGQNNNSLGIALEGNFQNENPTPGQMASLNLLIPFIRRQLPQNLQVYGHSDFANKPYDPNINLEPYKLNGVPNQTYKIGSVFYDYAPGLYECQDGTYTDLLGQGSCANHGGDI